MGASIAANAPGVIATPSLWSRFTTFRKVSLSWERARNRHVVLNEAISKGIHMNRMNPVDSGIPDPIDGGTERPRRRALIIAVAVAIFVGSGMMFYSSFSSPSTTVATRYSPIVDDFRSLEAARSGPALPTTTGQSGNRIAD